jgi:hypothetical protein
LYELKNGILHQNGKPIIAMGQSYYPSFHKAKYPLPEHMDRVALMKEDIRWMREVGFQFLRVAAIGDVRLEDDEVKVNTPFVDEMIREANAQGMAVSVRLQGYVMNLRGHSDYIMLNNKNEEMEKNWSAFMHSSLFHKGIIKDNHDSTQALARHFADMPGVVSYQIYNEPHYPYNGIFDYHPATLAAYQEWRKKHGLKPEVPPRSRPKDAESPEPWIQWRLFSMQAMSGFLNNSADAAKDAAPKQETYTCMTSSPVRNIVMEAGIDYFDNGDHMDIVGITSYSQLEGATYYHSAYQYAMCESAAALNGKHAWTIEIDARTHMPPRKGPEEVYALLAAGHKGIVFYEWRGDYPDKETPLPDNCGFIFNNGSKTKHYKRSVQTVQFVNQYSTLFAAAEKKRDGVAMLFSKYAAAYADAYLIPGKLSIYSLQAAQVYRELRQAGFAPDIVEARHLKKNVLGVKLVFVPCRREWLDESEAIQLDAFEKQGGMVYYLQQENGMCGPTTFGWWRWNKERLDNTTLEFRATLETADVFEVCEYMPLMTTSNRHLKGGMLEGDDYSLLILNNTDPAHRDVRNAEVTVYQPFSKAIWMTLDEETELEANGNSIVLPVVKEGGVLLLKR